MASPSFSTGNAISSNITVVPLARTAPTAGKGPLRTFHKKSCSAGSLVKTGGLYSESSDVDNKNLPTLSFSSTMVFSWNSINKAAAVSGNVFTISGMPDKFSTARREALSINSTIAAPTFVSGTIAWHAAYIFGKYKSVVDLNG